MNLSADEISVSEFEDSGRGFFTDPSILKQHKVLSSCVTCNAALLMNRLLVHVNQK